MSSVEHERPDNLLKEGILAAKNGHKTAAREKLLAVVQTQPQNISAWLWLAYAAESLEERVAYLQQVLTLDPTHGRAATALQKAEAQLKQKQTPAWHCPLCHSTASTPQAQCPTCGSMFTLTDPTAVLNNTAVRTDLVQAAVERFTAQPNFETDARYTYYLGLAHLNLHDPAQALHRWQQTTQLHPASASRLQPVLATLTEIVAAQAAASSPPRCAGQVLTVDDSRTIRNLVRMTLEKQQYEVILATDGLEALAKMNDHLPDLILLDITMPRMDGYQLCKIVKNNDATAHIPVVMLSGKDGFFDKVRGRMAGATDYITKPFKPQELVQVVQQHLSQPTVA